MSKNINPNLKLTTVAFEPAIVLVEGKRNSTAGGSAILKNIGDETFVCRSVSASCGCTTPSGIETGTTLEPGETRELHFSIQLNTPSNKYIYVHGNCTTVSLTISKNITE